jgi:hypothetical protein
MIARWEGPGRAENRCETWHPARAGFRPLMSAVKLLQRGKLHGVKMKRQVASPRERMVSFV